MDNHFKIIVPLYNVEKWIKMTIRSVKLQDYENFHCFLVDDMSTDESRNIAAKTIGDDKRFTIIDNKVKKYALKNLCDTIDFARPDNSDIIVILHGDDWLAHPRVLSTLNKHYTDSGCWLTYGSYIEYPSKIRGKFSSKVPQSTISENKIRSVEWITSHLQTFKYGLWKHIEQPRSFREPDKTVGEHHFPFAWDLAWMYPLVELAGHKIHFISDILYVYNRANPLNVDKVQRQIQLETETKIRNMKPYAPLKAL